MRRLLFLPLLGVLTSCHAQQPNAPANAQVQDVKPNAAEIGIPGITTANFPRMNGSTSASPLGDMIRARAVGLRGEMRRSSAAVFSEQNSAVVTFPLNTPPQRLTEYKGLLRGNYFRGTHEAYLALFQTPITVGKSSVLTFGADLILVAREPSPDELAEAANVNVEFDVRPVAMDGFVFLVNGANPVQSLTLAQIKDIYTGKITNWKEVGGKDEAIRAFTRDRNSGSEELMNKLVLKGEKIIAGGDRMLMGMAGPIDAIANTPSGIAYSVYYYEHIMAPRAENRLLAVNGFTPSAQTLRDGTYPLRAPVYVVTRKNLPPDSPAARLRDWLLSPAGQELVNASGYVSLPQDMR